jgi:putative molybdopterin biosynthesis protein
MSYRRNIYLKMKPLKEAREILFKRFLSEKVIPQEMISVPDAVGRVLAEPVTAVISSPNFHLSAMDGIAVKAANTFGASETRPKELIVGKDAFYVNTGHVMPENTDTHDRICSSSRPKPGRNRNSGISVAKCSKGW